MNKYNDLECSILSCLFLKPELMNQIILEDKHFVGYQRIWKFMKAFYKKFGNFDLTLMCSVASNKYNLMKYIIDIAECEPTPLNFELYQKQLIDLYNEQEKNKWIIERAYEITCDLWVRNITTEEYKNKINELYVNAEKIF